jgi:hypothetical protein
MRKTNLEIAHMMNLLNQWVHLVRPSYCKFTFKLNKGISLFVSTNRIEGMTKQINLCNIHEYIIGLLCPQVAISKTKIFFEKKYLK